MNEPSPNDLDWLAYCYVVDELSSQQREEFEHRLVDDQSAREAVARAVEWTQAAELACREDRLAAPSSPCSDSDAAPVRRGFRRKLRRVGWFALGVAASLLAVAGMQSAGLLFSSREPGKDGAGPAVVRSSSTDGHDQLAMAWSQTRSMFSLAEDATDSDGENEAELADEFPPLEETPDANNGHAEEPVETPSWMMAALAGMGQGGDMGQPPLDETERSGASPKATSESTQSSTEG